MTLVRQCRNTFIRRFETIGYVTSQLTKRDRVYDAVGAIFLGGIRRVPRAVDDLVEEVHRQFIDADVEELRRDFVEFVLDLERDGFVVTGDTPADLERRDAGFTYQVETPKTIAVRIGSRETDVGRRPTDEVMTSHFREHPTIFGAHFELTSACNERCVHCYKPPGHVRHADIAFALDLLDQLSAMGTCSLTLSGGEPTLHPQFIEILNGARQRDFVINVLSNGLHFSPELLDTLRDVNLNMIQISLYSMDPEIHDLITAVPGSQKQTLHTIEELIARDVPVQISCPIMKQNRNGYRAVSRWCHEHKVRVLSDFIMMARSDFDTSNLANRLGIDDTRSVIQDIITADDEYQLLLDVDPRSRDLEEFASQPVCGVAIDNACFTADGTMYPCAGFQCYPLGNVREGTVRDVWENSERVRFLRQIQNGSFPTCLRCEARDYCIMCLVRNFNESGGDMFKVADHFCQVAFLNKELVEHWRVEKGGRSKVV